MKKALHYFQKQALQYSDEKYSSAAYLSPRRNHEPQQSSHYHRSQHGAALPANDPVLKGVFSTATTAVDPAAAARQQRPSQRQYQPSYSSTRHNVAPTPPRISSHISRIQYASDHIRQSYELYLCSPPPPPDTLPTSSPSASSSTSSSLPASASSSRHASGTSTPVLNGRDAGGKDKTYWVVYVPGAGHMHDPTATANSFHPALSLLTEPAGKGKSGDRKLRDFQRHVKGYVSLNYRLASPNSSSGSPPDQQDAPKSRAHRGEGNQEAYEVDDASFDDALSDVLAALRHWQGRYPEVRESGRYLLVGHGFGALLAMNALMRMRDGEGRGGGIAPPRGIVGVNGVYDLGALHKGRGEFEALTRSVLGEEDKWEGEDGVSPVGWGMGRWRERWSWAEDEEKSGKRRQGRPRWVILAHSREDKLVAFQQAEGLRAGFEEEEEEDDNKVDGQGKQQQLQIMCEVLEINGRHNECWENGRELARVVREGIGEVLGVDQ